MLIDEFKNINSSTNELKKFALTIGVILFIISGVMFYYSGELRFHFAVTAILLIITGYVFPKMLLPFQKIWMGLAFVLGFIMSRAILILLFYLVISPIRIIALMVKKDFIDLSFDRKEQSYWNYREQKEYRKVDSERQF